MLEQLFEMSKISGWNDCGFLVDQTAADVQVVLVGEEHYNTLHQSKQSSLLRLVRPHEVLYEGLKAWNYSSHEGLQLQAGRLLDGWHDEYEEGDIPRHLRRFVKSAGVELIGCDLTHAEKLRALKRLQRQQPGKYKLEPKGIVRRNGNRVFIHNTKPSVQLIHIPQVNEAREQQMVKMIADYAFGLPIVAILGATHVQNIHRSGILRDLDIPYGVVNQSVVPTESSHLGTN